MQSWTPPDRRGFAQGITHAFARFGNADHAADRRWTDRLVVMARFVRHPRRAQPRLGGDLGAVLPRQSRRNIRAITPEELALLPNAGVPTSAARPVVPWRRLTRRMLPVTIVYFCYGWTLWLYLNWLPSFFLHEYKLDIGRSAHLRVGRVLRRRRRRLRSAATISDAILRRTGDLLKARRNVIVCGFLGSFVCLLPMFLTHNSDDHRAELWRRRSSSRRS